MNRINCKNGNNSTCFRAVCGLFKRILWWWTPREKVTVVWRMNTRPWKRSCAHFCVCFGKLQLWDTASPNSGVQERRRGGGFRCFQRAQHLKHNKAFCTVFFFFFFFCPSDLYLYQSNIFTLTQVRLMGTLKNNREHLLLHYVCHNRLFKTSALYLQSIHPRACEEKLGSQTLLWKGNEPKAERLFLSGRTSQCCWSNCVKRKNIIFFVVITNLSGRRDSRTK